MERSIDPALKSVNNESLGKLNKSAAAVPNKAASLIFEKTPQPTNQSFDGEYKNIYFY